MKIVNISIGIVALLLVVLIAVAPIGPMPGIFIGGTQSEPPQAWPDTSAIHEIKLRVPGGIPRVVIIWVIDYAGELYIVGSSESGWVKKIGDEARVEMRLGERTYPLQATLLRDNWQPMMQAYVEKYQPDYPDIVAGFPSVEEAQGQISVFKLNR